MANYVLAFRGVANRFPADGEDEAWARWFQALGPAVVDFGHRVGRVQTLGDGRVDFRGTQLAGYVVIVADDLDAAAKLAASCPGLSAGLRVEVGEAVDA